MILFGAGLFVALWGLAPGSIAPIHAFSPNHPPGDTLQVNLQGLVVDALEHALGLQSERVNIGIADAGIDGARAVFDPTLSVSLDLDRSDVTAHGVGPQPFRFDSEGRVLRSEVSGVLPLSTRYGITLQSDYRTPAGTDPTGIPLGEYNNSLRLSLNQPLLRGLGAAGGRAAVEAAERNLGAAEAQLQRQVDQTIASVEFQYWQLAQAEALEAVAARSLERAELLLTRNRQLLALEQASEVAVLTAESGAATREGTLLSAIQQRQDAVENLLLFVYGRSAEARLTTPIRTEEGLDLSGVQVPDVEAALAAAFEHRGELVAARQVRQALQINEDLARNSLLPTLNLNAGYNFSVQEAGGVRFWGGNMGTEAPGWSVGISGFYPLLNQQARSTHREFAFRNRQQVLMIETLENAVRGEVLQAAREIEVGLRVLSTAERAFQLALRQYEMEEQLLELGLSESFRLLQFEDQVSQAESSMIVARYSVAGAVTRFRLATGIELRRHYGLEP